MPESNSTHEVNHIPENEINFTIYGVRYDPQIPNELAFDISFFVGGSFSNVIVHKIKVYRNEDIGMLVMIPKDCITFENAKHLHKIKTSIEHFLRENPEFSQILDRKL